LPELRGIVFPFFENDSDSPDFDIELIEFPSKRKKKQA